VYFAAGAVLAVPFDLGALAIRGAPVPVAESVAYSPIPGRPVNSVHMAISRSGTLAYVAGSFVDDDRVRSLVWVDRSGRDQPVGAPDRPFVYPRLSPDGTRIGLTMRDQGREIWIWHIDRKVLTQLTTDPADDRGSTWTPDGTRIAFGSNRGGEAGTWIQAVDGSGTPTRLAGAPISKFGNLIPTTISPDGSKFVVSATGPAALGGSDLWTVPITGSQATAAGSLTSRSIRAGPKSIFGVFRM
jgi:serine/threonine-protein kinase